MSMNKWLDVIGNRGVAQRPRTVKVVKDEDDLRDVTVGQQQNEEARSCHHC